MNSSFEMGPREPLNGIESMTMVTGSTAISGWVVTGTNIDYYVGGPSAANMDCFVDLNGSFAVGGIEQTFATDPGARYEVSFAMAGNPEGWPTVKRMRVRAAGNSEDFSFDVTGKSAEDLGWEMRTWEFTASSDETTIEFETLISATSAYGPMLDMVDVRVKPD